MDAAPSPLIGSQPVPSQANTETPNVPPSSSRSSDPSLPLPRLKRFRFTEASDILLLKVVSSTNAHIAPWGQKGIKFEETLASFLQATTPSMLERRERPSQKSLEDRFKGIISKRRLLVKENKAASGIAEVYAERETLLDDIILEMDDKAVEDQAEKTEKAEKENRLLTADADIRNMALRCKSNSRDVVDVDRGTGSSRASPPASATAPRRRNLYDSDEDGNDALVRDIEMRRKNDENRLELEQKQFELERDRASREDQRFSEAQETAKSRLALDERRGELEIEERKKAIQERSKVLDVLGLLAEKLT